MNSFVAIQYIFTLLRSENRNQTPWLPSANTTQESAYPACARTHKTYLYNSHPLLSFRKLLVHNAVVCTLFKEQFTVLSAPVAFSSLSDWAHLATILDKTVETLSKFPLI